MRIAFLCLLALGACSRAPAIGGETGLIGSGLVATTRIVDLKGEVRIKAPAQMADPTAGVLVARYDNVIHLEARALDRDTLRVCALANPLEQRPRVELPNGRGLKVVYACPQRGH